MDFKKQESRPRKKHPKAMEQGKTCIDCHKGIAHKLPEGYEEED
jgi:cytochrome c-type protein NapC